MAQRSIELVSSPAIPAGTSNAVPSRRARNDSAAAAIVLGSSGAAGTSTRRAASKQMTSTTSARTERVIVAPSTEGESAATAPGIASPMTRSRSESISAGCHVTPNALRFWLRRPVRERRNVGIIAPRAARDTAHAATIDIHRAEGPISSSGGSAESASNQPRTSLVLASSATVFSPLGRVTGERPPHISGASVAARNVRSCSTVVGGASGPPSHATRRPVTQESCSALTPRVSSPTSGSIPNKRSRASSSFRCSFSRSAMTC